MKRILLGLLLLFPMAWAAPSHAQWVFAKKTKTNPSQRVPELILMLKTDGDERRRAGAAEELRDYDSVAFTEIVPVLVDVLRSDKKQNVRVEALNSLMKIRPVTQLAGQAIEKAAADDEAWRVRWQAKTALARYHLAGYVSKKVDVAKGKQTNEPPLAEPMPRYEPLPRVEPPALNPAIPRPLPLGVPTPKEPSPGPTLFP